MISQGKERRYYGADAQGVRGDALTVQDQFQLRRTPASVGGRTNSSRCSTLPVDWPGIRCHGPGHFYTNRSRGDLSLGLRRDASRRARRLGLTHAGPGRQFLRGALQRSRLQTLTVETGLSKPKRKPPHRLEHPSRRLVAYDQQPSERRLTRVQILFAFGATDE